MSDKIVTTPEYEALHAFDAEFNSEPMRAIAERVVRKNCLVENIELIDDISYAIETAYELGKLRGPLEEAADRSYRKGIVYLTNTPGRDS